MVVCKRSWNSRSWEPPTPHYLDLTIVNRNISFSQMLLHNSLVAGFIPEVVIPKDRGGQEKPVPYYGQGDDRIPGYGIIPGWWLGLLTHSKKILGWIPTLSFLNVLPVHVWVLPKYSSFPTQPEDVQIRRTGGFKLSIRVNVARLLQAPVRHDRECRRWMDGWMVLFLCSPPLVCTQKKMNSETWNVTKIDRLFPFFSDNVILPGNDFWFRGKKDCFCPTQSDAASCSCDSGGRAVLQCLAPTVYRTKTPPPLKPKLLQCVSAGGTMPGCCCHQRINVFLLNAYLPHRIWVVKLTTKVLLFLFR